MRFSFLLLVIMAFMACTDKTKVPSDVISKDKMEKLVWDVMLVEEYVKEAVVKDSTKDIKKERARLYQQVFDLHHTNREEFNKSFKYYIGRPDLTKTMFDSLAAKGYRRREDAFRIREIK